MRAYRRAAELIRGLSVPVAELVRAGRVQQLRGVGPGIERRLRELIETGEIAELTELRRSTPLELIAFAHAAGLSVELATKIAAALEISTVAELKAAALAGRLQEVPGVGPHREGKIVEALERPEPARRPVLLPRARELTLRIASALDGVAAGDARRWVDASTRLAVVATGADSLERFGALPEIVAMLDERTGVTIDGIPVELVVASPSELGTALVRATGPPEHVDALGTLPLAADEVDVYRQLGLPFPPPEIRSAQLDHELPALVELTQIRGDLHVHTQWSDGKATVLEMATAARDRGYEYLAICDHTPNVSVVPGLDGDALRRQAVEIAAANETLAPFRLLRGVECDIRADGIARRARRRACRARVGAALIARRPARIA